MHIGDYIRSYRTEKGMSLGAFAIVSGLSKTTVRKLEHKLIASPTLTTIEKTAGATGVTASELCAILNGTQAATNLKLSFEEILLVKHYRNTTDDARRIICKILDIDEKKAGVYRGFGILSVSATA